MGFVPTVRRVLDPYIQFGRFVPSISLLSPALVWFGIGEGSKLFLMAGALLHGLSLRSGELRS